MVVVDRAAVAAADTVGLEEVVVGMNYFRKAAAVGTLHSNFRNRATGYHRHCSNCLLRPSWRFRIVALN